MRPPDEWKDNVHQLAELLARAEGHQLLRLMNSVQLFAAPASRPPPAAIVSPPDQLVIGIWEAQRKIDGIHFVRSQRFRQEWSYWADVAEIGPKRDQRRVVVLGESVAHGLFLAPDFTPAKVLQGLLGTETEVVDMSRINIGPTKIQELNELVARHLAPDVIVHFSGNNWSPTRILPNLARREYALLLRQEDGLGRLLERRKQELAEAVRLMLDNIIAPAQVSGIPLVFVIPEFNFADWQDPWYCPWLANGRTNAWHRARRQAEMALSAGQHERAAALARQMIVWGQGLGGTGYDLLARCENLGGNAQEARRLQEQAWDARFLNPSISLGRCCALCREIIREKAAASEATCVDLRLVFDEYLDGELPDRRLFVDHCHMSVEGMKVAMAAVAEAVSPLIGGAAGPRHRCIDRIGPPPEKVDVSSRLALILQNSALSDELIEVHLQAVAEEAPEWLGLVLELSLSSVPIWLHREFTRLMASHPGTFKFLSDYAYASEWGITLAQSLLDGVVRVLESVGSLDRDQVDEALARYHSIGERPVNLLELRYSFTSVQKREHLWWMPPDVREQLLPASAFYRAYEDISTFVFVSQQPVSLSLTYRVPGGVAGNVQGRDPVVIALNGRKLMEIEASHQWCTRGLRVEALDLVPGRNRLRIRWPAPATSAKTALRQAARQMELGRVPELYPVFGEIHALTVRHPV